MKRSFIYLFALLAASTLAVSCQKDELPEAVASTFSRLSPFKGEVISDNASKTTLTGENQVCWQADDQVTINGTRYLASPNDDDATMADFLGDPGTPDPDRINGYYYAFFPANHTNDGVNGSMPHSSEYNADKFDLPMYAKSSSTTLQFYNTFADFRLKLKGTSQIDCIVVESLGGTALTGPYTVNDNVAKMTGTSPEDRVFTLNCNDTALTPGGVTFHIPLPAGQHTLLFRIVTSEGYVYERKTKEDVSISASKYYTAEMTPVFAGTFEINNSMQKVRFASGNLKYDGSQYTFANQFEYPDENTSTNQNFFTWNDAASDNNVSNLFTVDCESYRVLSKAEWDYVMGFSAQKRPGATVGTKNNARFVKVQVSDLDGDKNGLLLIPDDFNWPASVDAPKATDINAATKGFTTQYTQDKIQTLINAGCVFLPAAGVWDGSPSHSGKSGYYWSTTEYSSNTSLAYYLNFYGSYCDMSCNDKLVGRSLRLVHDLN